MRGITPITFSFVYLDKPDSKRRLADAYARIFRQAWKNIIDKQSTQKYTRNKYDKSIETGRISDHRGSSRDTQSDESYLVPNGTEGQNTSREVRESMENKLKTSATTS